MSNKKKIALLNLPVDNNFGGHLQRYALMEILRAEGADVTHLNCRYINSRRSPYRRVKCAIKESLRFAKRFIIHKLDIHDIPYLKYFLNRDPKTEKFYERYVPHTERIYNKEQLTDFNDYDAYVVGSDQVWRAPMATYNYGIDTYFFDYLPPIAKRYAYGVSLGTSENEFTKNEISRLAGLYKMFQMVSVREKDALDKFRDFGWVMPAAESVLDPTLLLEKEHYVRLVNNTYTKISPGNLFCYILDDNVEVQNKVAQIAADKQLHPFHITLESNCSVEQWLRSFMDSEYVITDSYHGFVFSLIFNKPFYLLYNERRGNIRFESLLRLMHITGHDESFDWKSINNIINKQKEQSLNYIKQLYNSI